MNFPAPGIIPLAGAVLAAPSVRFVPYAIAEPASFAAALSSVSGARPPASALGSMRGAMNANVAGLRWRY